MERRKTKMIDQNLSRNSDLKKIYLLETVFQVLFDKKLFKKEIPYRKCGHEILTGLVIPDGIFIHFI